MLPVCPLPTWAVCASSGSILTGFPSSNLSHHQLGRWMLDDFRDGQTDPEWPRVPRPQEPRGPLLGSRNLSSPGKVSAYIIRFLSRSPGEGPGRQPPCTGACCVPGTVLGAFSRISCNPSCCETAKWLRGEGWKPGKGDGQSRLRTG